MCDRLTSTERLHSWLSEKFVETTKAVDVAIDDFSPESN